MAARFCANCGAKLMNNANFCVECGERQPEATGGRARLVIPLQRYAPLFVVLAVVAVAAGAILDGVMWPAKAPSIPGRESQASGATGDLPPGHPAITIPEQVKQAIHDMQQKADANPNDVDTWKHLAEVQYRAGQLDHSYLPAAAVAYKHVLEHQPDDLTAIRNLGNIAFDQDQQDVAIGYYKQYLQHKPDDLNVQTDLATMYLSGGKSEQAIAGYDAVLKADPKFYQAQFNLAVAYETQGQTDRAVAALKKARSIAPDDKTRTQIDQLLARAQGTPAAPPAAEAGGAEVGGTAPQELAGNTAASSAASAPAGSFQAGAEALFRGNPIMGPKIERIEWPSPDTARVYFRNFPMDQMPPGMRSMFLDTMKSRIKAQKDAHKMTQTTHFELVDAATGKVMDTITE